MKNLNNVDLLSNSKDKRIIPEPLEQELDSEESLTSWGFADTQFEINSDGHTTVTGKRYPLSGKVLPSFLPWVEETMGVTIDKNAQQVAMPTKTFPSVINQAFCQQCERSLQASQMSTDPKLRERHNHGHTLEDIVSVNYEEPFVRIPDLILYPESEAEVQSIVAWAVEYNVCLIPYGGGTNVTAALQCPKNEKRMIVSVAMSRLNKILWIDPENSTACIQAGAVGRHIFTQLAKYGYSIGHEPDSVEFSTLGGWIATNASGMKKNRYGNIEDIVVTVDIVTAEGHCTRTQSCPRESIGLDYKRLVIGSEGNFGIITKAVVKIFPVPAMQEYDSYLFPDFNKGAQFLSSLIKQGNIPASVRLVDNTQFKFGMALKEQKTFFGKQKSRLEKFVVTGLKRFKADEMVAATFVFEGAREQVLNQKHLVASLAKRFGGLRTGSENGKRGYALTFNIAYIRDFMLKHQILGESFETSVPWTHISAVILSVTQIIEELHHQYHLPGKPFLSYRITQLYQTGVCIYFYFGFYAAGVSDAMNIYRRMEDGAREAILSAGGSLSHHHGVGKIRQQFLPQIMSKPGLQMIGAVKKAIDPKNIFGAGNGSHAEHQKEAKPAVADETALA